ncbi:DgyrCDS1897 [Dimorphilus gyrociliatus]|uniref:DgyrCDS1897 n=1 Tax=Dimorphilus gyrociliatus TaxID=2664684 RepID=A0A7I8VDS0_9ANNE|nr:DgyrCDS1897 [Dimorphilus gyrociliatus]
MRKLLLFGAICIGIYVAYEVQRIDVPAGFSKPGSLRIVKFIYGGINDLQNLCVSLGLVSFSDGKRFIFNALASTSDIFSRDRDWTDATWDNTKVRIYTNDKVEENGPAFVFIHGGGWVSGSPKSHHPVVQKLFNELQIFTVSLDYKMAPEHKYPGPEDDCEAAIVYLMKNAKIFKIDPKKIMVGGDSAGGHLSIQMAHRFVNRPDHLPSLRSIISIYPVTQPYSLSGPSYKVNENHHLLPTENMAKYWSLYMTGTFEWEEIFRKNLQTKCSYLKELHQSKILDFHFPNKYDYGKELSENEECEYSKEFWDQYGYLFQDDKFSILLKNFTNFPPTFLATMQYDVLRDDGLLVLRRLQKYGVKVEHYHDPKGFHVLLNLVDFCLENKQLIGSIVQFIKQHS